MDIGEAVKSMREGCFVARSGWNGKNIWLYYVANGETGIRNLFSEMASGDSYSEHVVMKTAQNTHVPWLCSQTDLLADDWVKVKLSGA